MKETLQTKTMNLLKLQRYQTSADPQRISLGLPTWESALLRGTLYDHRCPIEEFLPHYARQFDVVELSGTFTDLPYASQIRKLREEVEKINADFRFCPWIPRRVSHEFPLGDNYHDMREFLAAVGNLGPQLGPIILRLPESLPPESWMSVVRFARRCPKDKHFVVHLTHADWLKKNELLSELVRHLRETPMNVLIEDHPTLELPLPLLIFGEEIFIRFRGIAKPEIDHERLAMWVYRLGEYRALGIKKVRFILKEQEEMGLGILHAMAKSLGGIVRVPQNFDENAFQKSFEF